MDYDPLAAAYAAHRRHDEAVLSALRSSGRVGPSSRVLEVGCGTGSYAIALREATGCSCWGLDPSRAMLAIARSRSGRVRFVLGSAEALPFPAGELDLVFSVDVIHHVGDPVASLAEACRVLRGGGRACVVTEDEAAIRARLHSRYFPETVEVELARYPAIAELRSAMTAAGLTDVRVQRTASPHQVSDSRPYREKAFSSLHLIPEGAFRHGLERLERDLERGPIEAVSRYCLLWGVKPA